MGQYTPAVHDEQPCRLLRSKPLGSRPSSACSFLLASIVRCPCLFSSLSAMASSQSLHAPVGLCIQASLPLPKCPPEDIATAAHSTDHNDGFRMASGCALGQSFARKWRNLLKRRGSGVGLMPLPCTHIQLVPAGLHDHLLHNEADS